MTADDAATETAPDSSTSWRDLAVARSLDPARARAEKRVQRFLDAALELMSEGAPAGPRNGAGNNDFTVQQVVERSGQSLRSFYQYFAGKYELLLALFEESVWSTAQHLDELVSEQDDPMERLRVFVFEYYRVCTPTRPGQEAPKDGPHPAAIAEFAQQLLTEHPKEAALAFGPLIAQLEQILRDASAAGALRKGLDHRRIAGVLLQAIMFNAFATTISGIPLGDGGDEALWELALHGISAD
jgi:AcrR family transcriptional regulator